MKMNNIIFVLFFITYSYSTRLHQISNERYFFRPRGSNKCMDIRGSNLNGDYIVWPCHQGANQSWKVKYNSEDETYTLVSNFQNYVLTVSNNDSQDGRVGINTKEGSNNDNQRFCVEKASDGYYKLIAKHSGKCLVAAGDNNLNNIVQRTCSDSTSFFIQSPFNKNIELPGAKDKCTFGRVPVPAPAPIYIPVPAPAPIYVPVPAPAPAPIYVPVPAPASTIYVPVPAPASITSYFSFAPRVIIQTFPLDFFNGTWIVDGLICNDQYATLQVTINGFIASVLQGNECYKVGSLLFFENLPSKLDNTTPIAVNFYLSPTQKQRVWLAITGPTSFSIPKYNLVFTRKLC